MRTLRPKTTLLYKNEDTFDIGGSKVLRQSDNDVLTVAATGITVFEALKAADELQKENLNIRVVDCYSIHPVDATTLKKCLSEMKQKIVITVEDHFEHGGFGDFVAAALSNEQGQIIKMAVQKISQSGTMDELLNDAGINAKHIVAKVRAIL
jgi:transketolase